MKRLALIVSALLVATTALAITYGEFDGNRHPSTGAMIFKSPRTGEYFILCTGSLIAPDVFLTASHCTTYLEENGIHDVWVTFDSTFSEKSKLHHGALHSNPNYSAAQSDPGDIAVIVLDKPISGITPVALPKAGLFDQMKANGTLNGTKFTSVGYGNQQPNTGAGGLFYPFTNQRWVSVGEFNALNDVWLRLSQVNATGNGGTCYGDSGGPQFLGAGAGETNMQVSITITGDTACYASNVDYRLDTPQARAFLAPFVKLP
jgi:secreted trypsin-like serine protease